MPKDSIHGRPVASQKLESQLIDALEEATVGRRSTLTRQCAAALAHMAYVATPNGKGCDEVRVRQILSNHGLPPWDAMPVESDVEAVENAVDRIVNCIENHQRQTVSAVPLVCNWFG